MMFSPLFVGKIDRFLAKLGGRVGQGPGRKPITFRCTYGGQIREFLKIFLNIARCFGQFLQK